MAMRSVEWYCRVAHDGDHGGEGKLSTLLDHQRRLDRLHAAYGILAHQVDCLRALDLAMSALGDWDPYYVKADELRGLIATEVVLNVQSITIHSDLLPRADQ